VLGVVTRDGIDHDFGWVALGREEQLRFRAVAVYASLPNVDTAREQLLERLDALAAAPDTEYTFKAIPIALLSTSSPSLPRPTVPTQPSAS
jgi:hypothetical protein